MFSELATFQSCPKRETLFWPFFPSSAFWPCPAHLLIHIAQCPSCPAFCPRPALLLLCPLVICPPALPCPAMSSPALSSTALSSPALPANSPISGRSDRKVLRLIYIYIYIFREDAFVSYIKLSVVSVK